MKKVESKKVVLCTDLLIRHILNELQKNEVINMTTYGRAIKEVEKHESEN